MSILGAKQITSEDAAAARQRDLDIGRGDIPMPSAAADRPGAAGYKEEGPLPLSSVADTGLDRGFLQTLALKVMNAHGGKTAAEVAEVMKLPARIVRELLESLRARGQLETLGNEQMGLQFDLRYVISGAGIDWVQKALKQSEYVGPAPVPLAAWQAQVVRQSITKDRVDQAAVAKSLSGLVLAPEMVARLGPAVNAGRGILLYGAPGDGKTSIATAIANSFKQPVWVPYAIEVEGEIVKIYDPALHREFDAAPGVVATQDDHEPTAVRPRVTAEDRRWVRCARPIVTIGGELTMDMLDLKFDHLARFYVAPLHIKVTGGVFVIDDFGRQIATPEQVLNRWVMPLESRIDYLTLHTGKKFCVLFDGLVIFSTNLTPRTIMDSAMMRRIPYNFYIGPPTGEDYVEIFRRVCATAGVPFDMEALQSVMALLYGQEKLALARFHPRFIIEHVLARCDYEGRAPTLDKELALDAAGHLFTKQ